MIMEQPTTSTQPIAYEYRSTTQTSVLLNRGGDGVAASPPHHPPRLFRTLSSNNKTSKEMGLMKMMVEDIHCALQRDPAARNAFEVFFNYSGLHAIWFYRVSHWLWTLKLYFPARWLSQFARWVTGVEIHPGATIGQRFFIDHGMGVVIGETAEIGNNVTLYHGVTLGGVSLKKGKRHPTLGDRVVVGAGAKILGAIEVGRCSRIGANAVVVKPVPPNSVVVGVPGQIVRRTKKALDEALDMHHDLLPDTLGEALHQVMARLDQLEADMPVNKNGKIQTDEEGYWIGSDFSI
jgi:serine O-acetyltransferase